MIICANCGKELDVNANFCVNCGAQIVEVAEPEVIEPAEISLTEPDSFSDTENQTLSDDDKNFLDTTHRLLRWEQKAWKIGGTAYTILGAVFAGLYFLLPAGNEENINPTIILEAAEKSGINFDIVNIVRGGIFDKNLNLFK